jgi:hypothetical protein
VGLMAHSQSRLQSSQQVTRVANATSTDTITRIKLDAANQALGLMAQGWLPFQIIEFMGGPYLPRQTPRPAVANARMAAIGKRHLAASSQLPRQVVQSPAQASSFIQPSIETPTTEPKRRVRADSSTWRRIEPKPTGSSVLKYEDVPGTYTLMQQRFDQGDLAKTVEQQHLHYMMSRQGALSAPQTTPLLDDATPQASRRISQPTAHLLLQQATGMGSVTSNAQDADLASLAKQTISQLQRAAPNMQDTASLVQNYTMATETTVDANSTENVDDKGKPKTLKISKKKLKLSVRADKEATPDGTINQGPRCAKCIKGHKKCKHRTQENPASNLPLGSSPFDISSTPSNYVPRLVPQRATHLHPSPRRTCPLRFRRRAWKYRCKLRRRRLPQNASAEDP